MDEEKEQTNENQENQNGASAPEALEAIKAQLEEEQKARAELEQTMASKDARIAALETELSEAKQSIEAETARVEAATAELASAKGKYLGMAKTINPSIPEGIIGGATIEEIEQSVEKGKAIVEAVKKTIEAEAAATKVPAGAPTRGGISLEGLSPREKIAAGIQQKGVVA